VVDDILRQGIQGISELITEPGLVNVDFADVKAIMSESGAALMAIGHGKGENRAAEAARMAVASPLLDVSMEGARGVLFNVTGGPDLTLNEITEAAALIGEAADPDANIIFGAVINQEMAGEVKITLIATGFDQPRATSLRGVERQRPLRALDSDLEALEPRQPQRFQPRERVPAYEDEDEDLDTPAWQRRRGPRGS
jgi:cell division protein FtsZ